MTDASTQAPAFARPRAAAGVLFTNDAGEVLLVYPSYKDYLEIPGGYVEPGETPYQAATREVCEELSIRPPVGCLLVTDWWCASPEADGGSKILFIFDGGVPSPSELERVKVDGDEIIDWRFHPVSQLDDLTIPRLANRLRHAVEARSLGRPVYLESGQQAPTRPQAQAH